MSIDYQILDAIRERRLMAFSLELSAAFDGLPWWRWLRRYHLKRQLRWVSFAGIVYCRGQLDAAHDYFGHPQQHAQRSQ